jgi:hypothetical protein
MDKVAQSLLEVDLSEPSHHTLPTLDIRVATPNQNRWWGAHETLAMSGGSQMHLLLERRQERLSIHRFSLTLTAISALLYSFTSHADTFFVTFIFYFSVASTSIMNC